MSAENVRRNTYSLLFIMHDRPDYPGGPIINYRRLLPGLVTRGHDVSLICFYKKDYPNARDISAKGIKIFPLEHSNTKTSVLQILRIVEKIQPDAFIPDVSTPGCFAGKWVKKNGIPVITSIRGNDNTNWGRALYFTNPVYKHQVSGLMCVSASFRDQWLARSGQLNIPSMVIPSGAPMPTNFSNQQTHSLGLCYAGRLVQHQKNISSVVRSMVKICHQYPHFHCTIIGDGPEMDACKQIVAGENLINKIRFTGMLFGEAYSHTLAQHQLIVLLSDSEGTPGALLDGMACGLIPIVLRYPGLEELVEHMKNGIIIDNTEADLLKAVRLLSISESVRYKLSSNAKKTISSRYCLEQTVFRWENLISDCIENAGKKRHFSIPGMYVLPRYNPLLTEDKRKHPRGKFSRLFSCFDRITLTVFHQ